MAFYLPKFRLVTLKDVKELSKIHQNCFISCWSEESIKDLLKNFQGVLAETKNEILGFIIYSEIDCEAEIITFCVKKEFQNVGIGSKLLGFFIKNTNASKFFLEVSKENKKALSLYLKTGFQIINVRKKYYLEDGVFQDAFIMNLLKIN